MTLVLSNDDVAAVLTMPACIAALEAAYVELGKGRGGTRPRSDIITPTGREEAVYTLKSMDGVAPALGVGAVRINSDILAVPSSGPTQRRVKIPAAPGERWTGLVLLFSTETGEPLAIFPDGVLQRMRVGATNALGAKYLARQDTRTVGLIGAGWQAGAQVMGIAAVRDVERIKCFGPTPERREAFCREMSAQLGIEVAPVASPEEATAVADVVMCATNSSAPAFFARWLEPGMHLSSVKRTEIDPQAIKASDLVVVHVGEGTQFVSATHGIEPPRDYSMDLIKGAIDFENAPQLADVVSGNSPGRTGDTEITCFLNTVGMGYQFAVAGAVVYREAVAAGRGHELPTEWFTEDVHP